MFERMMEDPNLTTPEPRVDIDIDLVWGEGSSFEGNEIMENGTDPTRSTVSLIDYYAHITILQENHENCEENEEAFDNLCDTLTTCQEKYMKLFESNASPNQHVQSSIKAVFFTGLLLGIMLGCFLAFCYMIIRKCILNYCIKIRDVSEARDSRRNERKESFKNIAAINFNDVNIIKFLETRLAESFIYQRQSPLPVLRNHNRGLLSH